MEIVCNSFDKSDSKIRKAYPWKIKDVCDEGGGVRQFLAQRGEVFAAPSVVKEQGVADELARKSSDRQAEPLTAADGFECDASLEAASLRKRHVIEIDKDVR